MAQARISNGLARNLSLPSSILFCFMASAAVLAACGPKPSPRQRYVRALALDLEGNSEVAYDELIALAHDAPETRPGRRARAILTGGSMITDLGVLATLASVALPSLGTFSQQSKRASAKVALRDVAEAEHAYFATHNRFCVTFEECAWRAPRRSLYLYYLHPNEVVGGTGEEESALLRLRANAAISAMNLKPEVSQASFIIFAVGDPDEDGDLDIWSIDEDNNLVHLIGDG